jgi:hypothetical protein
MRYECSKGLLMVPSFLQQAPTISDYSPEEKLWQTIQNGMFKTQSYMKNNIYASTAHCSRYNALTLNTEVNNDSEPSLALYASIGNCIEDFVANALKQSNKLIDIQYKPKLHKDDPEINLSGIIDILYTNELNQLAILEVKSTSRIATKENLYYKKDGTVGKSKTQGIVDLGPSISHKTQAEIYASITGILDVSILYISRNVIENYGEGVAHHIYKVDTSYHNMFNTMQELYYAQLCHTENVVPSRPTGYRKTIECKYCDLLDACYNTIPNDVLTPDQIRLKQEAAVLTQIFMNNMQERRDMVIDDLVKSDKLRLV